MTPINSELELQDLRATDFSVFDQKRYPVVSAEAGYAEWGSSYDATVAAGLDRPLLQSLTSIRWPEVKIAADLACGTGRTGGWLKERGVPAIHGVDLTQAMLDVAASKNVYDRLQVADVSASGLPSSAYDLCVMALADEHLPTLTPVYSEAARLLSPSRFFVLVGYHPYFLMKGLPTHYHRSDKQAVTIQSHVHLFSEHFQAGYAAGMRITEFRECVIDEDWLRSKPKWKDYLHWPVSFALVWAK